MYTYLTVFWGRLYDPVAFIFCPNRNKLHKFDKKDKIKDLPEASAMVHSLGSTVNKRPSYRISAFDIKLILEPSSGIPALIIDDFVSDYDGRDFC